MDSNDAAVELNQLLDRTLQRYLSSDARVGEVVSVPLLPGMSGASVRRCTVTLAPLMEVALTFVVKEAGLLERRVLALLGRQCQPNVTFSETLDNSTDAPALLCLQDVGDVCRPSSLDPISDDELRREAEGLAAIHFANFRKGRYLDWLPRIDRAYVTDCVLGHWWRPAWEKALANADLRKVLDPYLAQVENAAERLADDMEVLFSSKDTQTLVHTDINPSNVLVEDGTPYYIDWSAAHYGPFYMDLPHHFCTLEQAEFYRLALAELGKPIPRDVFEKSYRIAARLIGFRYMWWTLADWNGEERDTAWVLHYVGLILSHDKQHGRGVL